MKNLIYIMVFVAIAGCSSSRITNAWQSSNATGKEFKKIMIVALIKDNDRELRLNLENHMAGDLQNLGYEAVSSLNEYGPKFFENMDESTALDKLKNSGVDAVITIVLLNKTQEKYYVPARINYSPYYVYHRHFWGYYRTIQARVVTPGYYTENTRYFWESNFYDLTSKDLLYSVQTQSFEPSSTQNLGHEYGKMIVKDLEKRAILINKKVPADQ